MWPSLAVLDILEVSYRAFVKQVLLILIGDTWKGMFSFRLWVLLYEDGMNRAACMVNLGP